MGQKPDYIRLKDLDFIHKESRTQIRFPIINYQLSIINYQLSITNYHTDSQSSASLTDLSRWYSSSFAYLRKLLWATAREST